MCGTGNYDYTDENNYYYDYDCDYDYGYDNDDDYDYYDKDDDDLWFLATDSHLSFIYSFFLSFTRNDNADYIIIRNKIE